MELVPFELLAARPSAREPAVHERQQVASTSALIRMAHEDLLRIVRVDGNLTSAAVIASTTEWAIETDFIATAVDIKRDATLGRRLFERCFRLELIDVDVTGTVQEIGGETTPMVLSVSDR